MLLGCEVEQTEIRPRAQAAFTGEQTKSGNVKSQNFDSCQNQATKEATLAFGTTGDRMVVPNARGYAGSWNCGDVTHIQKMVNK